MPPFNAPPSPFSLSLPLASCTLHLTDDHCDADTLRTYSTFKSCLLGTQPLLSILLQPLEYYYHDGQLGRRHSVDGGPECGSLYPCNVSYFSTLEGEFILTSLETNHGSIYTASYRHSLSTSVSNFSSRSRRILLLLQTDLLLIVRLNHVQRSV